MLTVVCARKLPLPPVTAFANADAGTYVTSTTATTVPYKRQNDKHVGIMPYGQVKTRRTAAYERRKYINRYHAHYKKKQSKFTFIARHLHRKFHNLPASFCFLGRKNRAPFSGSPRLSFRIYYIIFSLEGQSGSRLCEEFNHKSRAEFK